ncbi:CgeB family protein [Rhodoligotrophos defluvii]|uniref:CgeB family protein n=1 Tax=Rhodoligotrophos defluvii TaxID=2561934 RepID=UPI0010C959A5|nr:glycosyltransferase [Rhodoligotrophos defluvii]
MPPSLDIVVLGLSLSSSWGNGHATTYRGLLRALNQLGHRVLFLERDMPWYANHRDLADPDFCALEYYASVDDLITRFAGQIKRADAVIVGSYVPEGVVVIDEVSRLVARSRGTNAFCFYDIDTPVTLAKLRRGDEEYIARRQVPLFDVYFSFSGGPVLNVIEQEFGARFAAALYCSADPERYCPTGEPIQWDLGYLGTYSPDRQPALERLLLEPARQLPEMRFAVAGPQYPADIQWPANVERIEHLGPADHPSFYSRQRFTLNITRADMVAAGWSPSVRLFEAAACGTPVISDDWDGLDRIFPDGEAILIARSSEDVVTVLSKMTEAKRGSIGQAARACVLSAHTGEARAKELLFCLGTCWRQSRFVQQAGA